MNCLQYFVYATPIYTPYVEASLYIWYLELKKKKKEECKPNLDQR